MKQRLSIHLTITEPWYKSRLDFESHAARKEKLKRFSEKYGTVSHPTPASEKILAESVGLDGTEMDTVISESAK